MSGEDVLKILKYRKHNDGGFIKVGRNGALHFFPKNDKKWGFTHSQLGNGEIDYIDDKTFIDTVCDVAKRIKEEMKSTRQINLQVKKVKKMAKKMAEAKSETDGTGAAQTVPPVLSEESEISFAAISVPPIGESKHEQAAEEAPSHLPEVVEVPDELHFEAPGDDEIVFEAPLDEELVFAAPKEEGVAISLLPENGTQTYAAKDKPSVKSVVKHVEKSARKAHDKIVGKGKKGGKATIPRLLKKMVIRPGSARSYGDVPEREKANPKIGRAVEFSRRHSRESWEQKHSPEDYQVLGVAVGLMLLPAIVAYMTQVPPSQ